MLSHRVRCETGEEGLVWLGAHAPTSGCCPIESEQVRQMEAVPDAADEGEQPGEAVRPVVQEGLEAQQHVEQQGDPDLPAHGVGAVAEEVAQLQGLFDLLEENLDWMMSLRSVASGSGRDRPRWPATRQSCW